MEGYDNDNAPVLDKEPIMLPTNVNAANRLSKDFGVLTMLMELKIPPLRRLIGSSQAKVLYGFWDSLENSFGWSIDFGEDIRYEHGLWSEMLSEEHSNYKKSQNLVNALMRAGLEGRLTGFCHDDNVCRIKQPSR
jgi:hypothetical protein